MSTTLIDLSNSMAELVAAAGPSIVRVEARQRMGASGVVYSADGLIITTHHVVEQDDNIQVGLADGRTVAAKLIGRDPGTDLALLRAEATGLTPATWVEAGELKVGHVMLALGRPGKTVQATLGIVSALGGQWRTPAGGEIAPYLQTDVVMYPGFSGGPLVSANGQVAGLNSSALMRGVSITIPTGTVKQVVATMLAHGGMPRGYLGVGIQPVRLADALRSQLQQETGLMLMSVEDDGPGAAAGWLQGDLLITLDGQATSQVDDLQKLLTGDRVGKQLAARVVRSGVVQEMPVTVGKAK